MMAPGTHLPDEGKKSSIQSSRAGGPFQRQLIFRFRKTHSREKKRESYFEMIKSRQEALSRWEVVCLKKFGYSKTHS